MEEEDGEREKTAAVHSFFKSHVGSVRQAELCGRLLVVKLMPGSTLYRETDSLSSITWRKGSTTERRTGL